MKLLRSGLLIAAVLGASQTAIAADMAVKAPRVEAAPVWSWTGLYAGVHGGWAWTNDDAVGSSFTSALPGLLPLAVATHDLSTDGAIFGAHLGYNWQLNPTWVVGIEGEFTGANLNITSGPFTAAVPIAPGSQGHTLTLGRDVNWLASVRGRLGYTWGPGMIYATGGIAWADIDYRSAYSSGTFCATGGVGGCLVSGAFNDTATGWTIGAGWEQMINNNWRFRVEYAFYNFDGLNTAVTIPAFNGVNGCLVGGAACTLAANFPDLDIHTIRVGASYKF